MALFILKRLGLALLVALAVSAIAFILLRVSGDPAIAIAGEGARDIDIESARIRHGLDQPLLVQYFIWLGQILQGNFGQSVFYKTDVLPLITSKMPITLSLGLFAIAFALLISFPLGVLAAVYSNTWIDRLCLSIAVIGQALPNFFFALILVMIFSINLRWLPVSGSASWVNYIMPTIALGYYVTPAFMRLIRAGMIEVLSSDYIRTARAKGLSSTSVIFKHALRNAVMPVVALTAVQLGYLLGGSVVIETIFALDGLGFLAYQGIIHKDFPIIQSVVMILSVVYVLLTLLSDIANAWLNPRLRGQ